MTSASLPSLSLTSPGSSEFSLAPASGLSFAPLVSSKLDASRESISTGIRTLRGEAAQPSCCIFSCFTSIFKSDSSTSLTPHIPARTMFLENSSLLHLTLSFLDEDRTDNLELASTNKAFRNFRIQRIKSATDQEISDESHDLERRKQNMLIFITTSSPTASASAESRQVKKEAAVNHLSLHRRNLICQHILLKRRLERILIKQPTITLDVEPSRLTYIA